MKVKVDQIALIKFEKLAADKQVELPDGAKISDLLSQLGVDEDHQKVIIPFVNSERAKRTTALKDGDEVFFSLAIGGGA